MNEQKFFRCQHCGNMVALIQDAGVPMVCCNEPMEKLEANTTEASTEKHIPTIEIRDRLVYVQVGSVAHPMSEEHHIAFIYLQTKQGGQMRCLAVESPANAMFMVLDDAPIAVYAYCNLHGLWKAEVVTQCSCGGDHGGSCGKSDAAICSPEFSEGCK